MEINQKNVFGDNNVINLIHSTDRQLIPDLKLKILGNLKFLNVSSVAIRFEATPETRDFVDKIAEFIASEGYSVYPTGVLMSELRRGEFSISKHPSDKNFAMMRVGAM